MKRIFLLSSRPAVLGVSLLLLGCQSETPPTEKPLDRATPTSLSTPKAESIPLPPPAAPANPGREKIGQCQSELASLKLLNNKQYALRKAQFNSLVSSAGVYTAVREDVNIQTKYTLDALYKYKTNLVCADIERDVLQALVRRGESVK